MPLTTGSPARRRDIPAVREPRLKLGSVVVRGLGYGLVGFMVLVLPVFLNPDADARLTYVSVLTGLCAALTAVCLGAGLFFWFCCQGDIRRWRDFSTCQGRNDGLTIVAPTFVRIGAAAATMGACGYLLYRALPGGSG